MDSSTIIGAENGEGVMLGVGAVKHRRRLAVPDSGPLVAAVIVTQTLVELASEVVYVRLVPRLAPAAV